ncbi:uncharacterized protein MONOS_14405 [Monocercomonoides exilis]|uniref:uncharacterized protein n=1 Tax=Monocercomonoides exilis TaxID=2049356 RepID=UPI00355A8FA9|nr:hypothetical protein MONOS_14405 [Monocercomonoides exilis]|eukprot:MONOS_14405.1-p1 / transcript=MONOS_14405.1 / gene=MONOS_14405 / organism=Monocercomonoides_exilis_PA203 / gene_product=unspecified product / transcript_product=unspecified product / location=Mono_scaffold00996:7399-7731(-) / protein_length=111 / sequence_SO=supercontig / SO=protein_coding / is_pseudo=false
MQTHWNFFTPLTIPSYVLKKNGNENGNEGDEIALFVNLCSMRRKVIADETGGNGMDHNAGWISSPSVLVISVGSWALFLEDVVLSGAIGGSVITAPVFEVALRQLKMDDV